MSSSLSSRFTSGRRARPTPRRSRRSRGRPRTPLRGSRGHRRGRRPRLVADGRPRSRTRGSSATRAGSSRPRRSGTAVTCRTSGPTSTRTCSGAGSAARLLELTETRARRARGRRRSGTTCFARGRAGRRLLETPRLPNRAPLLRDADRARRRAAGRAAMARGPQRRAVPDRGRPRRSTSARGGVRGRSGAGRRMEFEEWRRSRLEADDFDPSLWSVVLGRRRGRRRSRAAIRSATAAAGSRQLGVRKPWRRRGLGLALLLHTFRLFHARGERRVGLGVDTENPTGATQPLRARGHARAPRDGHVRAGRCR